MTPAPVSFAFDIGHSSIGWAAFEGYNLKGCGTVFFGESCQNQKRAGLRRARRYVAATRNRVRRLRTVLLKKGIMNEAQLDGVVNAWPWHDATRVLREGAFLSWPELWNVIRWYAHNRGYDGNARWAREDEEIAEDAEKVQKAHELMNKFNTATMAETVCAALQCSGAREAKRSSKIYFKGYGAAFDRDTVVGEFRKILQAHKRLKGVDDAFIDGLIDDWKLVAGDMLTLPERYEGGLLFGQFVPRFNNRIIPACRITGKNTPDKHSAAFYQFRWMQTLAHVRVGEGKNSRELSSGEMGKLNALMELSGRMTPSEFKKNVAEITGIETRQLDDFFMTEEMGEGLVLDPALATIRKHPWLAAVWEKLSEKHRKIWRKRLFGEKRNAAGKRESLRDWFAWLEAHDVPTAPLEAAAREALTTPAKSRSGKKSAKTSSAEEDFAVLVARPIKLEFKASGRAAYCSEILRKATDEYFAGKNPKLAPNEEGPSAGVLYESVEVVERLASRPLAELTNNHLVRHRLVILERLLGSLVKKYAGGDAGKVGEVVVEVIRDLKEFSGLNDKEKAALLNQKLGHHRSVAKRLEDGLKALGRSGTTSAGLIRKARIADDQGWRCPYTGVEFGLQELLEDGMMDLDHIIPRSLRPSDSLDSLVVTFSEVNKLKSNRTAWQFIQEEHGKTVSVGGANGNKMIMTPTLFKDFVEKKMPRRPKGGWEDDEKRCKRRKRLLLTTAYNEREGDFLPKDLTQTSHLNKLAAAQIKAFFKRQSAAPAVVHLPGSATGAVRKVWNLMGCLEAVVPETKGKTKTDIRGISHLHHAVDAATLGWIATFLNRGQGSRLWEVMARRNVRGPEDVKIMKENGWFAFGKEGRWELKDLPEELKQELIACLAERNVVQHVPATRWGLKVEETVWGIEQIDPKDENKIVIHQKTRSTELTDEGPVASLTPKHDSVKSTKLLGYLDKRYHGKLGQQKGARIIGENYGVALDPEPRVIPYYKVHPALATLAEKNEGKWPRVLRNGMVIEVREGRYKGKWRVRSVKDNTSGLALNMSALDEVRASKINILLKTMIKDGLFIVGTSL